MERQIGHIRLCHGDVLLGIYSPSEKLSKKSETDTYSDGKSSTSSQILAMVIQTKLMETRVIDIDKEIHRDPNGDRYLSLN